MTIKVTYEQHDRDMLLAATLDITLEGFFNPKDGEAIDRLSESDPVNVLGGNYVNAMRDAFEGDKDAPQIMYQNLASMSDLTMHRFVILFGDNPLDFEPLTETE